MSEKCSFCDEWGVCHCTYCGYEDMYCPVICCPTVCRYRTIEIYDDFFDKYSEEEEEEI